MPNLKLTIDGVPAQIINFVELHARLTGRTSEQAWREIIASEADTLMNTVAASAQIEEHRLRKIWSMNEAIEYLRLPRGKSEKQLDKEEQKTQAEKERAAKK